jgi:hypothetical protein
VIAIVLVEQQGALETACSSREILSLVGGALFWWLFFLLSEHVSLSVGHVGVATDLGVEWGAFFGSFQVIHTSMEFLPTTLFFIGGGSSCRGMG